MEAVQCTLLKKAREWGTTSSYAVVRNIQTFTYINGTFPHRMSLIPSLLQFSVIFQWVPFLVNVFLTMYDDGKTFVVPHKINNLDTPNPCCDREPNNKNPLGCSKAQIV
jgi:hypothetical protein